MDFTVQEKGQSLPDAVRERMKRAEGKARVDYSFHCNITDFTSATLEEMEEVVEQGVRSFKVFMAYKRLGMMLRDDELLQVFAKAKELDAVMMLHAENGDTIDLQTDRLIESATVSAHYHPISRPVETEIDAVQRAIALAETTGVTLYIVHLTSGRALEFIHAAQDRGLPIIAETCPQYLLFTDKVYDESDGHCYIASPPFRKQEDCDFLWQGLSNGWISTVGTDHCPFTREQKESGGRKFHTTPNGLPGVETVLSLIYSEGVRSNRITLNKMVEVLCENPAKIFGLYPRKGRILEGADADLVIFDPEKEVTLSTEDLHSNSDWTPYEGWGVKGYPERVFLRGREIVRDGELLELQAIGKFSDL
jgi:dihydropyrimidinase